MDKPTTPLARDEAASSSANDQASADPKHYLAQLKIEQTPIGGLIADARNARKHPAKQIAKIAASIREFTFNQPVLTRPDGTIIAGHGRVLAAQSIGMTHVPTICLGHLTEVQQRLYMIADNRLAEHGGWDLQALSDELKDLSALDLSIPLEITGFEGHRLDTLIEPPPTKEKADQCPESKGPAISRLGDIWQMGKHLLLCGDATDEVSYAALMGAERARMVMTDPPYNVPISGNVGGLGKIERREFVMASGEMSVEQFQAFLTTVFGHMAAVSIDGAIHFVCMDWRHVRELYGAGAAAYAELKNLVVWVKDNAGMGTTYRSQHELIAVFKVGTAPHINNFGLGESGRYRTNVWQYPGMSAFGAGRDEALEWHPTVKPVALVADAVRDVSQRGDIVLDPFGGSGTTLIAAQKTGRRARLMELDPLYCDVICRRWESYSGQPATLVETGETFDQAAQDRLAEVDHVEG